MTRRLLPLVLLVPWLVSAQMKLFVVQGGAEQSVGGSYQVGAVAAGSYADTTFRVRNSSPAAAWFQSLTLAGYRFSFASLPRLPVFVAAGEAVDFTVRFAPLDPGSYSAFLSSNGVTTILLASGREADPPAPPVPPTPPEPKPPEPPKPPDPPLPPEPVKPPEPPQPRVVVEPQALRGGQQAKVAIRLASASEIAAAGELAMEFKPGVAGSGDDPAILFPATGSRRITFTVAAGEDMARFSGRTDTEFQTGTTAGSIVFTAKLGPHAGQFTAVVPTGYVVIDTARSARVPVGVEVEVTGFDTSRSASVLSFTFYDLAGGVVAPGAIQVDASRAFQQYFETAEFGGMFKLRAVFPVTGDTSQLGAVEAVVNNTLGSTQTKRLTVQ
jgi:hypothetical protein